jgi:hypothetical protein
MNTAQLNVTPRPRERFPMLSLQEIGGVAFKCLHPEDVIDFDAHGYPNGFSEPGDMLSEDACDELKQLGVSVLVYFSHAGGTDFDVAHSQFIAALYDITLCELCLPFKVVNLHRWDDSQWALFSIRFTRALKQFSDSFHESSTIEVSHARIH